MIITLVATLTGALVGLLLWSRLRTLAYRRPYDDVDDVNVIHRRPTHCWVLLLIPATWAWLTLTLSPSSRWAVLLWLPMSVALTWASAADLDVRRLPNRSLAAAGLWTVLVLVLEAAINDRTGPLVQGVVAAAACATIFFLLHLASRDGLGLGDVKLIAVTRRGLSRHHRLADRGGADPAGLPDRTNRDGSHTPARHCLRSVPGDRCGDRRRRCRQVLMVNVLGAFSVPVRVRGGCVQAVRLREVGAAADIPGQAD